MIEPVIISNLNIKVPRTETLRRLGYRTGQEPGHLTDKLINDVCGEASALAQQKAVYSIFQVDISGSKIIINGNDIQSGYLLELVKNCEYIAVMAVSIGMDICDRIHYYMTKGESPSKGVILDAAASEMVEAVMDYLHNIIKIEGARKGYNTTIRYSPGYKDFSLSCQKIIEELLNFNKIGINVTSHFLLNPEKSITAVAGWERKHA